MISWQPGSYVSLLASDEEFCGRVKQQQVGSIHSTLRLSTDWTAAPLSFHLANWCSINLVFLEWVDDLMGRTEPSPSLEAMFELFAALEHSTQWDRTSKWTARSSIASSARGTDSYQPCEWLQSGIPRASYFYAWSLGSSLAESATNGSCWSHVFSQYILALEEPRSVAHDGGQECRKRGAENLLPCLSLWDIRERGYMPMNQVSVCAHGHGR
jgi:hypothetical protein